MSERACERASVRAADTQRGGDCGRRAFSLNRTPVVPLTSPDTPNPSVYAPRSAYFNKTQAKAKAKSTTTPERRGSGEAWLAEMEARSKSLGRSGSPQPNYLSPTLAASTRVASRADFHRTAMEPSSTEAAAEAEKFRKRQDESSDKEGRETTPPEQPNYLSPTLAAATRVARRASFHRATMEPTSTEAAAEAETLRKRQDEASDKEGREPTPPEQRPKYMKPTTAAGARLEDRAETHRIAQERSDIRYRGSMEKAAAEREVFQRRLAEKAAQTEDRGPTPQAQRPTFHKPTAATTARIEDRAEAHKLSAQKSAERYKGDMGAANEQKVRPWVFKRDCAFSRND